MKKQLSLNLTIAIAATALVVAGILLPTGKLNGFCLGLGGSIGILFAGFHIGRYAFSARFSAEDEVSKEGHSPRPDVTATRQWVQEVVNASTANCIRVDGETHKDLLSRISEFSKDAPHYYILTAVSSSGRKIGRLFTGRDLGLAITTPCAWVGNIPHQMTEDEAAEYAEWRTKANFEYDNNESHVSSEECGPSVDRKSIYAYQAPGIISLCVSIGVYIAD